MNITFIGAGYVGLISSVALSSLGQNVICIDNDISKIEILKTSTPTIHEKDLDSYLQKTISSGHLRFSSEIKDCVGSPLIFIAVGTPSLPSGQADLSCIYSVIDELCNYITEDQIIVIKSTVPPTTSKKLQEYIRSKGKNNEIAVNPEFLKEGSAIYDFLNPDRIIVGSSSQRARNLIGKVYNYFIVQGIQVVNTDLTTAEMIKYASNCFLATKISFLNEMANLCEIVDANINALAVGVGLDTRIGKEFLKPGPGFGGSCFPKDLLAINYLSKEYGLELKVIDSVIKLNENRPLHMVQKIINIVEPKEDIGFDKKNICIGVLGLTYKAGTDDVRSSPSIKIVKGLLEKGYFVKVYDPCGMKNAKSEFSDDLLNSLIFVKKAEEVAQNAEAIVIATEWPEFGSLNFIDMYKKMNYKIIIDLRNMMDYNILTQIGFKYFGVGFNLDNDKNII